MNPQTREACLEALTLDELAKGKGTKRQQEAYRELEWRRCEADPEYWADHYGYIIDAGRVAKWDLWPIQREVFRELHRLKLHAAKHRESGGIAGIKARQLGITTCTALFNFWDAQFHDATKWDLFSHSEEKGKDIVDRVQATKDRQPAWMTERAQRRGSGTEEAVSRGRKADAVSKISFGLSYIKVASSTPKNIQGASSNVNLDEFTLHTEKKRKLKQMLATIDGASGIGIIIANGDGEEEFFYFYQQAKKGGNGFTPFFFWWGDAPHRLKGATITLEDGTVVEAQPVDGHDNWYQFPGMTSEQARRHFEKGRGSAPWYERERSKHLVDNPEEDEWDFRAIYPTTEREAFVIKGNSRFGLATIQGLRDKEHARRQAKDIPENEAYPPRCFLERAGLTFIRNPNRLGKWRIYAEPEAGSRYVASIDSAGGKQSGDYGVIQVGKLLDDPTEIRKLCADPTRPPELMAEQVAVFQAKVEPADLAEEAMNAGQWFNEAFLIPEANFHGSLIIDRLKQTYFNLYMRKSKVDHFTTTSADNIGFWSDTATKKNAVNTLAEWLNAGWLVLYDFPTLDELGHYEIRSTASGNETTGAPKGMNDDLVSGLYLLVQGVKDLAEYRVNTQARILMPWE